MKTELVDIRAWRGSPTGSDTTEPFHSNWQAAKTEFGVGYVASWEDPAAGFPEHARRLARALDSAGMPVHLRSIDPGFQLHQRFDAEGDNAPILRDFNDLLGRSIKHYLVNIYQVIGEADYMHKLTAHKYLTPEQLEVLCRHQILSTVFERTSLSAAEISILKKFGQVWVASKKDRAMLLAAGLESSRVKWVPICFYEDDPLLKLRGKPRKNGPVRCYHIGKWEARKAHHELLGVFLRTFKPGEATFFFKTSTTAPDFGDYPSSPEESLGRWAEDEVVKGNGWNAATINKNLRFIRERISQDKIVELHEIGDIYLSLSRGEGFDMPAFDSQLAGNKLVYTPSGGPQDFASPDAVQVPSTGLVEANPFYGWKNGSYIDWDLETACSKLRTAWHLVRARSNPRFADLEEFSSRHVGENMKRFVEELVARNKKEFLP